MRIFDNYKEMRQYSMRSKWRADRRINPPSRAVNLFFNTMVENGPELLPLIAMQVYKGRVTSKQLEISERLNTRPLSKTLFNVNKTRKGLYL